MLRRIALCCRNSVNFEFGPLRSESCRASRRCRVELMGQQELAHHVPLCRCRCRAGRLSRLSLRKLNAMMKNHPHPGELLREDVLLPLGIEVTDAATRLGMSRTTLSRVLHGHAGISPDLAVRLERAGVSTARFWMTLQSN